jgi:hypothetical protein
MTTEDKAQALVDDVRREYPLVADFHATSIALMRSMKQHEATKQELADFKQKVSDAAQEATEIIDYWSGERAETKCLQDFIIPKPKPDPLVEALVATDGLEYEPQAEAIRAALDAIGFEIREKGK